MKHNKTLTEIQSEAVESILDCPQNGKRAMGYGMSFLNRKGRTLTVIHREYVNASLGLGFAIEQAEAQWSDVKDMAMLESNAN